jgi:hypothetical protein
VSSDDPDYRRFQPKCCCRAGTVAGKRGAAPIWGANLNNANKYVKSKRYGDFEIAAPGKFSLGNAALSEMEAAPRSARTL